MTTQTQPPKREAPPRETPPKVPLTNSDNTDRDMLFQSMGQMQESYHGSSAVRKERVFMWIAGIGVGAIVFGLIYAVIFFLE